MHLQWSAPTASSAIQISGVRHDGFEIGYIAHTAFLVGRFTAQGRDIVINGCTTRFIQFEVGLEVFESLDSNDVG